MLGKVIVRLGIKSYATATTWLLQAKTRGETRNE